MSDDWSNWDDDSDSPVEIPVIGDADNELNHIEKSLGIPHKYRVIMNWVAAGLLVYLITKWWVKRSVMRSARPVQLPYGSLPPRPPMTGASRMMWDTKGKRWLVDVNPGYCAPRPGLCSTPQIANQLCSYTCHTLGMASSELTYEDPLSPLSMMPY